MPYVRIKDTLWKRVMSAVREVERRFGGGGVKDNTPYNVPIRMRVKSVGDDHLVCRTWDGTTEGTTDINVAKPFYLQKTPYHGKTITINGAALTFSYTNGFTRTVTKAGVPETQIIIPAYTHTGVVSGYGGEEIWVQAGVSGGTGVTVAGEVLKLQQVPDARMWAKQ